MTTSVEARILELERRIQSVTDEASACVRELLIDDGARFLIAERLPGLGSVILPTIHEFLANLELPEEARTLAALVGVAVGDRGPSVLELIAELERGGEYAILAARYLAAQRVPGIGGVILKALRASDPRDVDTVVAFLAALRESGVPLPESERIRLLGDGGWQVRSAVAENFPVEGASVPSPDTPENSGSASPN